MHHHPRRDAPAPQLSSEGRGTPPGQHQVSAGDRRAKKTSSTSPQQPPSASQDTSSAALSRPRRKQHCAERSSRVSSTAQKDPHEEVVQRLGSEQGSMGCKGSKKAVAGGIKQAHDSIPANNSGVTVNRKTAHGVGPGMSEPDTGRINLESVVDWRLRKTNAASIGVHPNLTTHHAMNVVDASPSLWFCLASMSNHRTYDKEVVIIDTRRRKEFRSQRVVNAVTPWRQTSKPTDDEKTRLLPWLKSLCDLRTVLLYGSCRTSSSSEERLSALLQCMTEAGVHPKEVLVLYGGVDRFLPSSSNSKASYSYFISSAPLGSSGGQSCESGREQLCVTELLPSAASTEGQQQAAKVSAPAPSRQPPSRGGSSASSSLLSASTSSAMATPKFSFGLYVSAEAALFSGPERRSSTFSPAAASFVSQTQIKTIVNLTSAKCPLNAKGLKVIEPLVDFQRRQADQTRHPAVPTAHHASAVPLHDVLSKILPPIIDSLAEHADSHRTTLLYDVSGDFYAPIAATWFLIESGNTFARVSQFIQRRRPTVKFDSFLTTFFTALSENFHRNSRGLSLAKRCAAAREDALKQLVATSAGEPQMNRSLTAPITDQKDSRRFQTGASEQNLSSDAPTTVVNDYYKHIDSVINDFRRIVSLEEFNETVSTLNRLFNNVLLNPNDDKFRSVKLTNAKFHASVGRHPHAVRLLSTAGWVVEEESGVVELPKSVLLQKMRDVQSRLLA